MLWATLGVRTIGFFRFLLFVFHKGSPMTEPIQQPEIGTEDMNKGRLRAAVVARRRVSPDGTGATRLLRVLIIDDDRDTVESVSRLVRIWGHETRQAYDTLAGLELAVTYRPDLILLDIGMPAMDGCRMAREIRLDSRLQGCFVVAIGGYANPSAKAAETGAPTGGYTSANISSASIAVASARMFA
jgi:CheY-like chemotaxis protein